MWDRERRDETDDDRRDESSLVGCDTDELAARYVRGQIDAFGEIWRRHYGRMRGMARRDLRPYRELSRLYEVDDALSDAAAQMTHQAMSGGLRDKLTCRNDFWLFFRNVLRQCIRNQQERHSAIKRGGDGSKKTAPGGRWHRIFSGRRRYAQAELDDLNLIPSREVAPDILASTEDLIGRLFALLDEEQRHIASLSLSDYPIAEIALRMYVSERTVARRLEAIRRIWGRSGLLD